MLPDKHDAGRQAIEPVARPGVKLVAAFRAQDLHDRVVMISSSRVDRHTGRFVNDKQVIVFVNDANWETGDGWFVSMEGMRNDLAVSDDGLRTCWLAVNRNLARLNCLSLATPPCQHRRLKTAIGNNPHSTLADDP